jgi:uncharacterized membrane protein
MCHIKNKSIAQLIEMVGGILVDFILLKLKYKF